MLATAGTLATQPYGAASDNSSDPIPMGTDHAVFGEVNTTTGHPPDATPVKITVYHVDHYTEYDVLDGVSGGWYSKTLPGTEQGTNWDIGDDVWVNVTYSGNTYYNQTVIMSTTNQQIDVNLYGPDYAVWGCVYGPGGANVSNGTPVRIVVYHNDHYTTYEVDGGTSSGYYTKTLPGGGYGINWQPGDSVWVNVTYMGTEYSNLSYITNGTNQQIDIQVLVVIPLNIGWNLISLPSEQTNTSIEAVLSSIDGKYDRVKYYDSTDQVDPWKTYRVGSNVNDLSNIDHTMGFWLHATVACSLNVNGTISTPTNITLLAGWNLVGYATLISRQASIALGGTGTDMIAVYNGASPYLIDDYTDLSMVTLLPGEGYWVHVPADTVWTVDW